MTQIVLFLISVYSISWALFLLLQSDAAQGKVWAVLGWLLPVVWGPTIVALILTLAVRGAVGVKEEIRARLSYRRGSGRWLLLAGVVPIPATAVAVFIARAAGDVAPFISSAAILPMLVLQVITGAVGEELGWRGFLLPRLGKRFGGTTAAWAMGFLWALWHLPGFFFPGMPHQMMPLVSSLLFTAFFGVFLAFVFNQTGESVLATILVHLVLNITFGIGGVALSSIVFWRTMVGIYGTLALLTVIASRKRASPAAQPAAASVR